jgi:hypothetical protein
MWERLVHLQTGHTVHQGTGELLIQEKTMPDGKIASV